MIIDAMVKFEMLSVRETKKQAPNFRGVATKEFHSRTCCIQQYLKVL
jgi:hypothetical protein